MNVLSQTALPAAVLTDAYVTVGFKSITSLVVCNRSATQVNFRMSLASNGEMDALKQYLFYDVPILPNDSFVTALEVQLYPKDVVRAYASAAELSLTIFGDLTFKEKTL